MVKVKSTSQNMAYIMVSLFVDRLYLAAGHSNEYSNNIQYGIIQIFVMDSEQGLYKIKKSWLPEGTTCPPTGENTSLY